MLNSVLRTANELNVFLSFNHSKDISKKMEEFDVIKTPTEVEETKNTEGNVFWIGNPPI